MFYGTNYKLKKKIEICVTKMRDPLVSNFIIYKYNKPTVNRHTDTAPSLS